jgi:hypothetical protein
MQHHANYFTFQADTNFELGLQLGAHFKDAVQSNGSLLKGDFSRSRAINRRVLR